MAQGGLMSLEFRHASLVDGVRFTAQVGMPNVVLGLFKKRELPTQVASALHAEQFGYLLVQGLVRRFGPDPFYIRVAKEEALLVHHPDDIRLVLDGSPDPFASDPEAKRKGMAAFQPDALTISRGALWANRRRFAEAVLETGQPLHQLAATFLTVANEEADRLARHRIIRWADINAAFQRITRRVVLGDSAADDRSLTADLLELMAAGNKMPGTAPDGYEPFLHRIQGYVDTAEAGSLCALIAEAPSDEQTSVAGQVVHWLFAMGDTLPANLFRALALLATHPLQLSEVRAELALSDLTQPKGIGGLDYLSGCIQEAMRLWPTTQLFGRVTTRDVRFPTGAVLPAGKQVLVYNLYNHRNRDRIPYADRFAPEEWVSGEAGSDWSFNFFSHGPQGCPGAGLSLFLGQAVVARLLEQATPRLSGASLKPGSRLPYGLDIFGIAIHLDPLSA
jgi:cytochrome P450